MLSPLELTPFIDLLFNHSDIPEIQSLRLVSKLCYSTSNTSVNKARRLQLFSDAAMVYRKGHALQHVTVQTEEICKLAVQQNGFALKYVALSFANAFLVFIIIDYISQFFSIS
jgi:hypothetical protein